MSDHISFDLGVEPSSLSVVPESDEIFGFPTSMMSTVTGLTMPQADEGKPDGHATPKSSAQQMAIPATSFIFSESPAPLGYLANPYLRDVEQAHDSLNQQLALLTEADWAAGASDDGVSIVEQPRDPSNIMALPPARGRTFIPGCRPIEVLACIHLFGYRLIWDNRVSSGRILQRYNHHSLLFYSVWRGIGVFIRTRDAVGVQDVRCWGAQGERQSMALPESTRIDVAWRSVDFFEVPHQAGKDRMHIQLAGYRIEWQPENGGSQVTFVGDVDDVGGNESIPSYIWRTLSRELPKIVGGLRGAIQHFGWPPYVLDLADCVVIQTTFFDGQTRKTTHRHHVRWPGSYSIMLDRPRMFPNGVLPLNITGDGASAVSWQEAEDCLIINVGPDGVGKEYVLEITPRDDANQSTSRSAWW